MIRVGLVLLIVAAGACAVAQAPARLATTHEPDRYWIPRTLRDRDQLCVPDGAFMRCRTVRDVREFVLSARAAP